MEQKTLWGHPRGLYVLFFAEMWERFSYYGMRAIFVLYLTAKTTEENPGLGWDNASALSLYGWYTMMVYVMCFPGGILADRVLGQKKTVMLGGFLLCAGHLILAIDELWAFYTGIALIVLGVGALKPNISSMVGSLYRPGDARRDNAFYIFYVGINIGAFTAPLLVGYLGEVVNWHYGFGLAGIGMALGQIVYVWGQKYLKGIGDKIEIPKKNNSVEKVKLTKIEKDRLVVLFLSFIIVIIFFGAYEQAGGLMNLYADQKIDRTILGITIPASFFQSLPALYVILFSAPVALFWTWWRKRKKETSTLFKMGFGTIITGVGFLFLAAAAIQTTQTVDGKAAVLWLFAAYLFHVIGELCLSPLILSFTTKMAPARYVSFAMGAFFLTTGLGSKLAGFVGESAQAAGELNIFLGIFAFCVFFGLVLILFVKKLKKLTHGADDVDEEEIVKAEPQ